MLIDTKCFECGGPAAHLHHVIPRSKGGKNTVPLCQECHGLVHFRVDDAGSLLRHAYLSAQVALQKVAGDPQPTAVDRPAPPGTTWLDDFSLPVKLADLAVTDGDRGRAEREGQTPEFFAGLRAKVRAARGR